MVDGRHPLAGVARQVSRRETGLVQMLTNSIKKHWAYYAIHPANVSTLIDKQITQLPANLTACCVRKHNSCNKGKCVRHSVLVRSKRMLVSEGQRSPSARNGHPDERPGAGLCTKPNYWLSNVGWAHHACHTRHCPTLRCKPQLVPVVVCNGKESPALLAPHPAARASVHRPHIRIAPWQGLCTPSQGFNSRSLGFEPGLEHRCLCASQVRALRVEHSQMTFPTAPSSCTLSR